MSQESSGDASPSGDESDVTDLMSVHVFRKPSARKVYLRNMVLLETECQDILRYVLMIFVSVDKIVAYVQENMFALREVISGLSLGPAEYDLRHRNRGYGLVMTVIQENSSSASLCIFALTSYGMITWIVVLAATQKMKELMCYPRNCSRTEKKRFQRASSSSRKMMKSMLFCILVYSNLQAASAMERAMQQLVEVQGRNMETVQAFMQQVTELSSASSQQSSALSQAITDFGRIAHETQTKTLSGIESALESYSSRAGASELHTLVKVLFRNLG